MSDYTPSVDEARERPTIALAREIASWDQDNPGTGRIPHWAVNLASHLIDKGYEKADREPSERLMVAPAIQAVRDVLDGLEDWEIQDHALEEIRSAVDDIPDCELATAIPHEEHGEPSDAEVEAAARGAYDRAFLKHAPEDVDRWDDLVVDNDEAAESWREVARAALLAAQEVRNRG